MKKTLLSLLMTGALLLNLGSSLVMAEGVVDPIEPPYADDSSVPLNKKFTLTNEGTISPAETFNFTLEPFSVTNSQYTLDDMPVPTGTYSIPFTQGEATTSGDINSTLIDLPEYDHVGIFTYLINEKTPTPLTAGVTYDDNSLYLKVTVIEQDGKIRVAAMHYENESGSKTESFTNTFSAGNLTLAKTVTGNMGEKDRDFNITVTFTAPADTNIETVPISYTGGRYTDEDITFTEGVATLDLQIKHGDTISFNNLPYGVGYSIVEEDYTTGDNAYTTTPTGTSGSVEEALQEASILNHKDQTIDTGITLENMPYIILIGLAVSGLAFFALKRKRREES